MIEPVKIGVMRVVQPIGEFYIGSIPQQKLLQISYTEVRSFIDGTQKDLAGIQRERSLKRVREISEYVRYGYATFPTSVVLAIDERMVELEQVTGCDGLFQMTISEAEDDGAILPLSRAAFIIDGQHRLAAFEGDADLDFDINVSIFVGADLSDKAEIFGRVNLAQTKVNRSLVYDLLSYSKTRSPHRTMHEVTIALNREEGGPFENRIKRLGKADPGMGRIQTLAQATVVDGLLKHVTSEAERERNRSFLNLGAPRRSQDSWRNFIFQPFYDDEEDEAIFQIVRNYFSAIQGKWPTAWNTEEKGYILNRTTGYNALARFLGDAYLSICDKPRVPGQQEFWEVIEPISLRAGDFTSENFLPGSSGSGKLYRALMAEARL
ncbi:MAG: DGQHR domain-containing protein [Pseudomonadota bacterium]